MSALSEWLADDTPCGQCGHAKGEHFPPDFYAVGCRWLQFEPDACECVGWQA